MNKNLCRMLSILILVFMHAAQAQPVSSNAPVQITTNLVTAAPNFRRVNGVLYNTDRSQLWQKLTGEVQRKQNGVVIVSLFVMKGFSYRAPGLGQTAWERAGGSMGGFNLAPSTQSEYWKEYGRQIAITNLANYASVAAGNEFRFTLLRVGTYEDGRQPTLELWDCGVPNQVTVIRTNQITLKP